MNIHVKPRWHSAEVIASVDYATINYIVDNNKERADISFQLVDSAYDVIKNIVNEENSDAIKEVCDKLSDCLTMLDNIKKSIK